MGHGSRSGHSTSSGFFTLLSEAKGTNQIYEAMDPSCQQDTMQAGIISIMVCDMFPYCRLGLLVCLNISLSNDRYVSLLRGQLHPWMSFIYPQQRGVNPIHFGGFRWMVWLQHSPNMNPMEHLWEWVERSACTKDTAPSKYEGSVHTYWNSTAQRLSTSSVHLRNRCI